MGICFSTKNASPPNGNNPSTSTTAAKILRLSRRSKPPPTSSRKQEGSHQNKQKDNNKNQQQQRHTQQQNVKARSRKPSGVIPCGKRTDFGYDKDFDARYTIGKLLGHGQFGYTYVAFDKFNGDRVAVKRIEKDKVINLFLYHIYVMRTLIILYLYDLFLVILSCFLGSLPILSAVCVQTNSSKWLHNIPLILNYWEFSMIVLISARCNSCYTGTAAFVKMHWIVLTYPDVRMQFFNHFTFSFEISSNWLEFLTSWLRMLLIYVVIVFLYYVGNINFSLGKW